MLHLVQIELTNKCNLDCVYCPRPHLKRKKESMKLETFEKILEVFGGNTKAVGLSKDGEPLLHPDFNLFIDKLTAVHRGMIDIYTNGILLTEDKVDKLGSVPNVIRVLVTEHHYGRQGSQRKLAERTRDNLLKALKKGYDNLQFHITLHCPPKCSDGPVDEGTWEAYWKGIKANSQNLMSVNLNKNINPWLGFVELSDRPKSSMCPYAISPNEQLFFGVTGNALACCVDLNEELVLGNILTHTGDELRSNVDAVRERLRNKDMKDLAPCNRCVE